MSHQPPRSPDPDLALIFPGRNKARASASRKIAPRPTDAQIDDARKILAESSPRRTTLEKLDALSEHIAAECLWWRLHGPADERRLKQEQLRVRQQMRRSLDQARRDGASLRTRLRRQALFFAADMVVNGTDAKKSTKSAPPDHLGGLATKLYRLGVPDPAIVRLLARFGLGDVTARQVARIRHRARGEYFFPVVGRGRIGK